MGEPNLYVIVESSLPLSMSELLPLPHQLVLPHYGVIGPLIRKEGNFARTRETAYQDNPELAEHYLHHIQENERRLLGTFEIPPDRLEDLVSKARQPDRRDRFYNALSDLFPYLSGRKKFEQPEEQAA